MPSQRPRLTVIADRSQDLQLDGEFVFEAHKIICFGFCHKEKRIFAVYETGGEYWVAFFEIRGSAAHLTSKVHVDPPPFFGTRIVAQVAHSLSKIIPLIHWTGSDRNTYVATYTDEPMVFGPLPGEDGEKFLDILRELALYWQFPGSRRKTECIEKLKRFPRKM
jgi:hypothetical protein